MFCRLRQCRQILPKLNLSAILLLFLIKRAALGNLKVNFHCSHLHRFFSLKKGLSKTHQSSLNLKGGPTAHLGLLPSGKKRKPLLLNSLYDPFSSPCRGRKRRSVPLRYMVGGPSEVYASSRAADFCAGMSPPCGSICESELSLRSFAQPFPSGYRGRSNRTGLILFFKNLHKTFGK